MSSKTTDRIYYEYTPSQKATYLQLQYSIHKQVVQIPFYLLIDRKLDFDLLKKAVNVEISRNDSLRLRYAKRNGKNVQYFVPPYGLDNIPVIDFSGKTMEEQDAFLSKDAGTPLRYRKGEVFRVILYRTHDGRTGIYLCVFHLNMDAMAVFQFFTDLMDVYVALKNGTELPPPLGSFEKGIKSDLASLQNTAKYEKDDKFYREFFLKDGKTFYAAPYGIDRLKKARLKKKDPGLGYLNIFDPIHDKSKNLRFHLSPERTAAFVKFCEDHQMSFQALIYLGLRTHLSKINDCTDDVYFHVICNRRVTLADKRSGGCRMQALPLRTVIGKDMTFLDALAKVCRTQFAIYRHSDHPTRRIFDLVDELENRKAGSNTASMLFTCMPLSYTPPEDWKVEFGGYSTGRFSFPLYSFTVPSPVDGGLDFYFEFQTYRTSDQNITDLYNNAVKVIEAGIADPHITIGEILDRVL